MSVFFYAILKNIHPYQNTFFIYIQYSLILIHFTAQAKIPEHLWPAQAETPSNTWSHFDAVTRETNAQGMLRSLQQLQDSE